MNVLALRRWAQLDAAEQARIMDRATASILDPKLLASIGEIYADVAARGDQAVADATLRFDRVVIAADDLLVSQVAIDEAHATIDPALLDAIRVGIASVRAFNEAQLTASPNWRKEIRPGVVVGERHHAIPSAGLFVPCGKGSFPSVLVMIGTPAVVAGVPGDHGRSCRRCPARTAWTRGSSPPPRSWASRASSARTARPAWPRWRWARRRSAG